jgi:hypothetical protein
MNIQPTVFDSDGRVGSTALFRRYTMLIVLAALLAGCGRTGDGVNTTDDPEMSARLAGLTRELHHAMVGRKLNRDFDEFVAVAKLEVPPPPSGKKYAINEKWKVVLVNK